MDFDCELFSEIGVTAPGAIRRTISILPDESFERQVEAFRKRMIFDALAYAAGNQAAAARALEMPYHRFRYYYRKYTPRKTLEACS